MVSSYQTILEGRAEGKPDGKDKAFAKFLLDLPSIPADVLDLLRDLSVDHEKYVLLILWVCFNDRIDPWRQDACRVYESS